MAIIVTQPNILILEPVKCGTTWIRSALTECNVDWSVAESVSGVCPRHSYREHYRGDFSQIYCPIRSPYSWLVSYYNFHRCLKTLPFLNNHFYGHRPFGASMPSSFEDFVEYSLETKTSVSGYFQPFVRKGTKILRQERLRIDLAATLKDNGVEFDQAIMNASPKVNESDGLSNWSQVPGHLFSEFKRQERWILRYYRNIPAGIPNA